jgi:hypothetical protein
VCDDGKQSRYSKYTPCDSKFNGGNYYYSDDSKDANLSAAPSKNFKIYASASSSGSSMKSVRINSRTGAATAGILGDAKGYTCSGSSCEVCHEAAPARTRSSPLSMLNVKSNGDRMSSGPGDLHRQQQQQQHGHDPATIPHTTRALCGQDVQVLDLRRGLRGKDYDARDHSYATPDPEPAEPEPEDPAWPNDLKPTAGR